MGQLRGDRLSGDNQKNCAHHSAPGGDTTSIPSVSPDNVLLALAPLGTPLVIGQRGIADLLGDLSVATDDLSS
jgi:hypothetical protein